MASSHDPVDDNNHAWCLGIVEVGDEGRVAGGAWSAETVCERCEVAGAWWNGSVEKAKD